MDTLILTHSYMPHRVVGWQKAITMSFIGKVEVVETYDTVVRSPSLETPMPAVARLTRTVRVPQPRVRFSRKNVFLRDGHTCQYCRTKLPAKSLTLDHVVPRAQGGRTSWDNITTACRPCNFDKRNRTPKQAGMKLLQTPVRPRSLPFAFKQIRVDHSVPDAWKNWVWWDSAKA